MKGIKQTRMKEIKYDKIEKNKQGHERKELRRTRMKETKYDKNKKKKE